MKVKLGDSSQFYGENSDPAIASSIQDHVLLALSQHGLKLTELYEGTKGRDVWFEIADASVDSLVTFVRTLKEVGPVAQKTDEQMGTYLDVPVVFEKRVRRRRR